MQNPRFVTVTLTLANTNYNLLTLLQSADSSFASPFNRARRVAIQADFDAGGARFLIGNSDLSAANYGVEMVATQSVLYEDNYDNVLLNDIFLRCDTAGQTMHVTVQFQ